MLRLAIALALLLLQASSAWAHASLVRADPVDGAVLPRPPPTWTLTFNEPVAPLVVRLISPAGEPIVLAGITAQNTSVIVPLPAGLSAGTHALSWRVISADGHPVGGTLMLSIGAPSGTPRADAQGDATVHVALWAARVAIYLALFVGVGGAFFRAWLAHVPAKWTPVRRQEHAALNERRACPDSARTGHALEDGARRASRILVGFLVVGLFAVPLSVALQGLDALDLTLSSLPGRRGFEAGLATTYGGSAIAAACAIVAGLASIGATPVAARALALGGICAAALALALSGHASTAAPQLVSRPALLLHGLCVAFWVGALLPLVAGLRMAADADAALARFSRAIPLVLAGLLLSGAWLAFAQLDGIDALWRTSYGRVLAAKLTLVVLLIGLGAVNRFRLVPRLSLQVTARRWLARSIGCEIVLAVAILGLVAAWRFTPPPRALAALVAPISFHLHGERVMAEIAIDRAGRSAGQGAQAQLLVLDGEFRPLTVKEVALVLANPAAGIEPIRRAAMRTDEPHRWRVEDVRIPLPGQWTVRVEALVSDFEKISVEDRVALPRLP